MSSSQSSDLTALLEPRSIAIIGASSSPSKIGGRPLEALVRMGYAGDVYPVNGVGGEVQGVPAFARIEDVPGSVDLAIVALPRESVEAAVEACARKGVRAVVLFSAGFAEVGEEGAARQDRLVEIARSADMRLLGPNCMGAANMLHSVAATFSAATLVARDHDIAEVPRVPFVSQSGAVGGHAVTMAARRGFEFDPWITTGNQSDIDVADCIEHFVTRDVPAVAVYVEGIQDGPKFDRALRKAREKGVPVVLLKAGSSAAGEAAAASHTAALTGSDAAYQALFDAHDVSRVRTLTELLDTCYALARGPRPTGDRVLALTMSGGVGIVMADRAEVHGLDLPEIAPEHQGRLREVWPLVGAGNPVDTTAQVLNRPGLMPELFEVALQSAEYDAAAVFMSYLPLMEATTSLVVDAFQDIRAAHPGLPVYASMVATDEARSAVEALGIPVFEEPDDMLATLARAGTLGAALLQPAATAVPLTGQRSGLEPGQRLTEHEGLAVLRASGVPTVQSIHVLDAEQAVEAARQVGHPVVLKISSPEVAHKSDVGGVLLGVTGDEEVARAHDEIRAAVSAAVPDARMDGVVVAPMVSGGVEMLLGVVQDPALGPHVVVGLGGVHVEVFGDVVTGRAPLDESGARDLISRIRGRAILEGVRGAEPADLEALVQALVALSQFAAAHADVLESVDINPFLVLPRGQGGVAVDALIVTRES